ncbi:MAG TPA: TolC family protein [Gemmatimonadales bacterium]|jgi:cobalt-zinc-cadmium efflux system outer membrane protein|nr:TolC family protein [Gemmatimonadales bacterium]
MTRIALLALAGLLAGYSAGRSQTPPPSSADTCRTTVPADSGLTLRDLLLEVRARHPALEAARARVRAARGNRSWARAIDNPTFGVQLENVRVPGKPSVPMDRETMYTAMLPLENIYQRGPRVRQAGAELAAASADTSALVLQLFLDAAHAYYRTALVQLELETATDLAGWLDSVAAYNRLRAKEGLAAEADLLRSELERDRMTADAAMRAADLAGVRAVLAEFLPQVRASPRIAVPAEPLGMPETPALGGSLPRVEALRQRLRAMDAAVAAERSMLIPQLGFMVGAKESAGRTSLLGGLSLPLPLLNRNGGRITRARGERDAVAFELAREERAARAALAAATESSRRLSVEATALGAKTADGGSAYLARAEEVRRIALGAYREGAVPLITVVDAARAWGDARITYYQLLFAQHEAVLAHFAARGIDPLEALAGGTRP